MNPDDAPAEQLTSYIAPAAPATRRPADGDESYLRPEIGFGPAWYHESLGIDFDHRWHNDVDYRLETVGAMRRVHGRQRESGVDIRFATVSNCLVNMVSPEQYQQYLLPLDVHIARAFETIGIHNCAWRADPYLELYASVPNLGYIDMGLDSNLAYARRLMPRARRGLMYTPMDLAGKLFDQIEEDLKHVVEDYGPCDLIVADIESNIPDGRILDFLELCGELGGEFMR